MWIGSLSIALARGVERDVRRQRIGDQPAQLQPAALAAIVAFGVTVDAPAVRLLDERERSRRSEAAKIAVAVHQPNREPHEQPVRERFVDHRSQFGLPVAAEDDVRAPFAIGPGQRRNHIDRAADGILAVQVPWGPRKTSMRATSVRFMSRPSERGM